MIHSPITDAAPLLAGALRRSAAAAGVVIEVIAAAERPWASLTFTGTRHRLTIAADAGPVTDEWLSTLGSATLSMRGHVAGEPAMVDRQCHGERCHATLEILTIEDG